MLDLFDSTGKVATFTSGHVCARIDYSTADKTLGIHLRGSGKSRSIRNTIQISIGILMLIFSVHITSHAQHLSVPVVNIGDPSPPLKVKSWIKGTPVKFFEKGKVYIVEFWATWCRPCIAEMPHLSAIANKYKDNVTVIGVDIYEPKTTTLKKVKAFVDSMGREMNYNVAVADDNFTEKDWLAHSGEITAGIPRVFIIDRKGDVAWIGHPCNNFEESLGRIVNREWDINKARSKRNSEFRLRFLDDSLSEVLSYAPDGNRRSDKWMQDSGLLVIEKVAGMEPLIQFAPQTASRQFYILLKTDIKKAYNYGKMVLETETYEEPAAFIIMGAIEKLSDTISLTPEIYQLGIDAIQKDIDFCLSCYPELKNFYKRYYKMAEWYWHIGNRTNAIQTLEHAIQIELKDDYLKRDLLKCKDLLKQYEATQK